MRSTIAGSLAVCALLRGFVDRYCLAAPAAVEVMVRDGATIDNQQVRQSCRLRQAGDCSDFDVILAGDQTPAFRVLLPEHIVARGLTWDGPDRATPAHTHIIPGTWTQQINAVAGHFCLGDELEVAVCVATLPREIRISLTVKNTGRADLTDVMAHICTGVGRLPGAPGWCNRDFIPSVAMDRSLQGRYWFEHVTPHGLSALTGEGWVTMHPCPSKPDADMVPEYSFVPSAATDTKACAVRSANGKTYLYQAWNVPSRHCTPCPGSACMHLIPYVTDVLKPGDTATILGTVGIHCSDRASLTRKIQRLFGRARFEK